MPTVVFWTLSDWCRRASHMARSACQLARSSRFFCAFAANWVHNIGRWRFPTPQIRDSRVNYIPVVLGFTEPSQVGVIIGHRHRCFDGGKELH
jgi:hypothetical protein